MLEPAVRPVGGQVSSSGPRPTPGGLPFEQTPFEKLLNDARQTTGSAHLSDDAAASKAEETQANKKIFDPLARLHNTDRIENATLRQALANSRGGNDPTDTQ